MKLEYFNLSIFLVIAVLVIVIVFNFFLVSKNGKNRELKELQPEFLTFIISLLTVAVTLTTFFISENNKNKELELARINSKNKLKIETVQKDREWKYKLSEFMIKNKKDIFSEDEEVRNNIRSIMSVSFPSDILKFTFSKLSKLDVLYSDEWEGALALSDRIGLTTVFIQVEKGFPSSILEDIPDTIGEGDISYVGADEHIPKNLTEGDVRYFTAEDESEAKTVLNDFVQLACTNGYELNLKIIPLIQNKHKNIKGTVEVWLSHKAVKKVTDKKHECYDDESY